MSRGANNSSKPTQQQRRRMRSRGKDNGIDYCDCCPPEPHPTLDWCMTCQKRIRTVPLRKDKHQYAP